MFLINSMLVSHTVMYAQCKTMAVLVAHLPLLAKQGATDSSSLQQASGYNTSCMVAYAYTTSDFLNNTHRDSKHCKCMASPYKHMGELQSAITLILRR